MPPTAARPARLDAVGELLRAVRQQDWDHADVLLRQTAGPHDGESRRALTTLHMHRHRWAAAAAVAEEPHRTLCRNLAALKAHRPLVYRTLMRADPSDAYRPHRLADGTTTVARVTPAGGLAPLCGDPAAQVRRAVGQLAPASKKGDALAVMGVADGHVLASLVAAPPKLFMDRQQAVYLIEPDPRLLLACLHVHDFTGPLGPIEQARVLWYVGAAWAEAFRLDLVTDRYLPFPSMNVKQTPESAAIERAVVAVLGELGRLDAQAAADVATHYAARSADDFAAALASRAGRPARVMLLTTRLSTVLQHSTRDAEDAFRRLGCTTALVIEPSPFHALTRMAIRRTLAEFKPDLVLQIDHHRFEHGDLFPPNLPFVNWIQDLLPHLMTPDTGRRLGPADFTLTPSTQRWTDGFAYPARQCMEFRKLTRLPRRPTGWCSDGRRVVYVSNWSQRPGQVRVELLAGLSGPAERVTAAACDRMEACYAAGNALSTAGDVRRLVLGVLDDLRFTAPDALVHQTVVRLFDRLNNLLYRQQGLAWAADACEALGLSLEIYGTGWDTHPTLARHARGPVGYGGALEELTRSAGVNLVLEPFVCIAHQRLLDATAAGGFCLMRENPPTDNLQRLLDLVATAQSTPDTAAALAATLKTDAGRRELAEVLADFADNDASADRIDPVAVLVGLQDAGFLPRSGPLLPHLRAVTFGTPEQLRRSLDRYSRDAELRSTIAGGQRKAVAERYSYVAGMQRVLAFVGRRMAADAVVVRKAA